ncbi:MAG: hypothetical protein AAF439_04870 [Pseudomonadota bacterium]
MFRVFLGALLLATAACGSTSYTENGPNMITTHRGHGGYVLPILKQYDTWAQQGKFLRIDGPMISADAMGAFGYKGRWCYTEDAVFRGHAAYELHKGRSESGTVWLTSRLPEKLAAAFRKHPAYQDYEQLTYWGASTLRALIPEYECRDHGDQVVASAEAPVAVIE